MASFAPPPLVLRRAPQAPERPTQDDVRAAASTRVLAADLKA
jgi:hypothetical protein